ncbi:MAG: hypothetical protein WCA39_03200 [Nitrososphaeraceae archaeon]
MRIPIAEETRQEVITKWLSGWARDKIAGEIGVGAGTVTNIIARWTDEVGIPTAGAIRELSVEIRRADMSIRECARGLRITRVLSSKMVDDEVIGLELFVDKVYNKCKYLNISPDHLVELASEIWELSKNMPTSQIPSYLAEKMKERESLETEIKKLNTDRSRALEQYNKILQQSDTTGETLEEYNEVRGYLSGFGLGIADLNRLRLALQNGERHDFDVNQIVQKISRNQSLEYEEQELQKRLAKERDDLSVTKNTSRVIEMDMEQNAAKIKYCDDLSSLGFGLDELRKLKDALLEIAKDRDSGSSVDNATDILQLLFKQIEEFQNLESRIESLKKEKNGIEEARKMLINDLRDFIEQTKKDVKEVSDLAIQAIKVAQEDKRDVAPHNNSKDIT